MTCIDCGQEFVFTSGEQSFFAERGFTEAPKRCAGCRAARKAQRGSNGGGSYGSAGDGERRPRELHTVVCADCGRNAQVPFQPTGARPVYCSACFETRR